MYDNYILRARARCVNVIIRPWGAFIKCESELGLGLGFFAFYTSSLSQLSQFRILYKPVHEDGK